MFRWQGRLYSRLLQWGDCNKREREIVFTSKYNKGKGGFIANEESEGVSDGNYLEKTSRVEVFSLKVDEGLRHQRR